MLNFNKPKTVADILSTFTKTLTQLNVAEEANISLMNDKTEEAERLVEEAKAHRVEATYASEVAAKIAALITPTVAE